MKAPFEADLVISETGEVLEIVVVESVARVFDKEVSRQLRRVPFTPATMGGPPTKALYRAILDFSVER